MQFLKIVFPVNVVCTSPQLCYITYQCHGIFLFQNPVQRIPDSHEITLKHGTKTVSLEVWFCSLSDRLFWRSGLIS